MNKKSKKKQQVIPGSIANPWSDDFVANAIRSGEIPVKPLPGYDGDDIGWAVMKVSLEGYQLPKGYADPFEEDLEDMKDEIGELAKGYAALAQRMKYKKKTGVAPSQCYFCSTANRNAWLGQGLPCPSPDCVSNMKHLSFNPDEYIGIVGLNCSNLGYQEKIWACAAVKITDKLTTSYSVIGFSDRWLDVDGRRIYLQRQCELKANKDRTDRKFWRRVFSMFHQDEHSVETATGNVALWPPAHLATLAEALDEKNHDANRGGGVMMYQAITPSPQPRFDIQPDCYERARAHISEFRAGLQQRFPGICLDLIVTSDEFDTVVD